LPVQQGAVLPKKLFMPRSKIILLKFNSAFWDFSINKSIFSTFWLNKFITQYYFSLLKANRIKLFFLLLLKPSERGGPGMIVKVKDNLE
jgi:hypothetical protein